MRKRSELDRAWSLDIDEDGTMSGDIEAIRVVYHKKKEIGLSFDDIPYCG
jgi:hypothetical protein